MAIQLLRALTNVTVIATASQPVTKAWCANLGAHHVLDHSQALSPQVAELGIGDPGYVFSTARSGSGKPTSSSSSLHKAASATSTAPRSSTSRRSRRSASHSTPKTHSCGRGCRRSTSPSREILRQIGELVDAGKIRTTLTSILGAINAANLPQAHRLIESGTAVGKFGLEGFTAQP
ncbi:zinc-binding dehydrogenase [Leucobacter soli]|uniref:zinc-binding dehydrogenase n=1 Tax=Leucobacter soli TaxID=2812850 RepID=UPI0036127EB5